jgi:hypothetical protein
LTDFLRADILFLAEEKVIKARAMPKNHHILVTRITSTLFIQRSYMNMRKRSITGIIWTICFIVCFMGLTGITFGYEGIPQKSQISDVSMGTNGISFRPKVRSGILVLTVSSPDGSVFHKSFEAGSSPNYQLSATSPDGVYNYELRAIPGTIKKTRENMKEFQKDRTEFKKPLIQSGQFLVQGGRIVTSGGTEPEQLMSVQDHVIYDDLIVDGSFSVGNDSVNGYNFRYDTIVLRENNLRIFFDDTSGSSSFPNNDWRIIANSISNGGTSFFSIQDATAEKRIFTVEAGAPAHSLYVEDAGQVGLGTSTPSVELHIADGDSPAVRLDQDGSAGWTPQRWDLGGNETNLFIRDVTNGSTLPFRIRPGAPSNCLMIGEDGRIGIGTAFPTAELDIETTGNDATMQLKRTDGATAVINAYSNSVRFGSKSSDPLRICSGSDMALSILTNGNVGIGKWSPSYIIDVAGGAYCDGGDWINGSSLEYKDNIQELTTDEALEALQELNPVKFHYKSDKNDGRVGFIAEDVPDLVATQDRKGLSPMEIVAVLTKVIQKQQDTIGKLQEKITELEEKTKPEK